MARPPVTKAPKPPAGASEAPASPERADGAPRPGPEAEWVHINTLTPWAKNPRKISDRAVSKVARLIKKFGWTNPIIVNKNDGIMVAGHTRRLAALKLGMDKALVRYMDLTPKEARALAIADNRSGEESEWDETLLAQLMREMKDGGEDLADLAFDDDECDKLLSSIAGKTNEIPRDDSGAPDRSGEADPGDEPARGEDIDGGSQSRKNAVISYTLVFETDEQQQRWFGYLRWLKTEYPMHETVGGRVHAFLEDRNPDDAG